jgi:hypothetical protein
MSKGGNNQCQITDTKPTLTTGSKNSPSNPNVKLSILNPPSQPQSPSLFQFQRRLPG